ncbi:hypothetical protein HZA86_00475 [Candidatus Uhrbacteria bacterium]|nr:hypothetical protein [Candidatus Uhrbacteria bacterium]
MAESPLYVAITIDLDPDNFDTSIFGPALNISWRGVEQGIPSLLTAVDTARLEDSRGRRPRFTWFVRSDTGLYRIYGTSLYLFERFKTFLRGRAQCGDEIGWHPHVTELDELQASFQALQEQEVHCASVRVGNAFHSNSLMAALAGWGLRVDSTALPGRVRHDRERTLDWTGTPSEPYFPSLHDYRIPSAPAHPILEVPMSMIYTKASYDRSGLFRYLNLSYRNAIVKESIVQSIQQEELLVAIVHPSELLERGTKHPLISFDCKEAIANIVFISQEARVQGRELQYITIADIARLVQEKNISYAPNVPQTRS